MIESLNLFHIAPQFCYWVTNAGYRGQTKHDEDELDLVRCATSEALRPVNRPALRKFYRSLGYPEVIFWEALFRFGREKGRLAEASFVWEDFVRTKIEDLQNARITLGDMVKEQEEEIAELKLDRDRYRSEVESRDDQIGELEAELAQADKMRDLAVNRANSFAVKMAEQADKIAELETTIKTLFQQQGKAMFLTLSRQMSEIEARLDAMEADS